MDQSINELNRSMFLAYSVVSISDVDGRLDAEHYDKEALQSVRYISSLPNTVPLRQLAKVVSGPFGSSLHASAYQDRGIPFIRASNVKQLFISGDLVHISRTDHERLNSSRLKTNDIVMYKIGAGLGNIGLLTEDFDEANISENMIGIIPYNKDASAFLAVFLLTKYGQLQIQRQVSYQAQPKMNVADIVNIQVPKPDEPFRSFISSNVQKSYLKRKEANQKYKEAESILVMTLGEGLVDQSSSITYLSGNNAVMKSTNLRLDADYYGSAYSKGNDSISKSVLFRDIAQVVTDVIDPTQEPSRYIRYISIKDINAATGEVEQFESISGWKAPSRARLLVKARDILLSSLKGSLDKVGIVPNDLDGAIASTGFFVIRELGKNFPAEALFMLLRTPFVKNQLQRKASGAIMEAISSKEFKSIWVPDIRGDESIELITSLVNESFNLRRESRHYIEQAKTEVEYYIERSCRNDSTFKQQ